MPRSGQIMGEEFSSHCQVLNYSTHHWRSVFHTLQEDEVQWQSMMDLSKYLSNREQWCETILQDSVACRECCWPWSHLSKCGNTLGCLLPLHHSNMNWEKKKKKKPQTFKETYFLWGIISRWKLVEKGLWFLQLQFPLEFHVRSNRWHLLKERQYVRSLLTLQSLNLPTLGVICGQLPEAKWTLVAFPLHCLRGSVGFCGSDPPWSLHEN